MNNEFQSLKKETKIFYSPSRGPGGQRRDRKKTAVRLHHLPSGLRVSIDERSSQAQNKKIAFEILRKRLRELKRPKKKRIPIKIPARLKEKRLEEKKRRSLKKKSRRKPIEEFFL